VRPIIQPCIFTGRGVVDLCCRVIFISRLSKLQVLGNNRDILVQVAIVQMCFNAVVFQNEWRDLQMLQYLLYRDFFSFQLTVPQNPHVPFSVIRDMKLGIGVPWRDSS
jgi:hypothetical protein